MDVDDIPSSEEILCGRCCCPLQKARIKRSTKLTLTGKAGVVLSKDINLMQHKTFCLTEVVRTTLEIRLLHVATGLFGVKGFMPNYAATGFFTSPSLVCAAGPWQRRKDGLPWPRANTYSSTASQFTRFVS